MKLRGLVLLFLLCWSSGSAQEAAVDPPRLVVVTLKNGYVVKGYATRSCGILTIDVGRVPPLAYDVSEVASVQAVVGDEAGKLADEIQKRRDQVAQRMLEMTGRSGGVGRTIEPPPVPPSSVSKVTVPVQTTDAPTTKPEVAVPIQTTEAPTKKPERTYGDPSLSDPTAAIAQFGSGLRQKFSTKDHPKAKGVCLTIEYPTSWSVAEGVGPNIVQRISPKKEHNGTHPVFIIILAKALPPELQGVTLTDEDIKTTLYTPPPSATLISLRRGEIGPNREPAGITEYTVHTALDGSRFFQHVWSLRFLRGKAMVEVGFSVVCPAGGEAEVSQRMAALKPLFASIADTIVFIPESAVESAPVPFGLESSGDRTPRNIEWLDPIPARPPAAAFIALFLLVLILSWTIGLAPALFIRYVSPGRPLSRSSASWIAAGIAAVLFFINSLLAKETASRVSVFYFIMFFVSRWLMSRGYVTEVTPTQADVESGPIPREQATNEVAASDSQDRGTGETTDAAAAQDEPEQTAAITRENGHEQPVKLVKSVVQTTKDEPKNETAPALQVATAVSGGAPQTATSRIWVWLAAGLVMAVLGTFFMVSIRSQRNAEVPTASVGQVPTITANTESSPPASKNQPTSKVESELSAQDVYEKAKRSVLVITALDASGKKVAFGSGFILQAKDMSTKSVIVTNAHVLHGACSVEVKTFSGKTERIETALFIHEAKDIAVLPTPASLLEVPALKGSDRWPPSIGETVYALGAPKGLEFSLTRGLVSQVRQDVPDYGDLIQTDASISSGSSGGPLLDSRGEVMGMTTLASRAVVDANDLNFAVTILSIRIALFLDRKRESREMTRLATNAARLATNSAAAHIKQAEEKREAKDYSGALEEYDAACRADPNLAEAFSERGFYYLYLSGITPSQKRGNLDAAHSDFNKAIQLKPGVASYHSGRARVRRDLGDMKGALDDCNKAIELEAGEALYHSVRARVRRNLGDLKGALDDCNRAIELKPGDAYYHSNRAGVRKALGDLKGALDDCNRAIELEAKNEDNWDCRAGVKDALGDFDGAMRDWDEAIRLKPELFAYYHNRGLAKYRARKWREAIEDFDKAIALAPSLPWSYEDRGNAKKAMGDTRGAARDYETARRLGAK